MRICVQGLWHLGSTTAACLSAAGFKVLGFDEDRKTVKELPSSQAPFYEPRFDKLTDRELRSCRLSFSNNREHAIRGTDILWICHDTPVDKNDYVNWGDWIKAVEVNLFGLVYACRGVFQHFRGRHTGKIVNPSGGGARPILYHALAPMLLLKWRLSK